MLYLYALLESVPTSMPVAGVAGGPVRVAPCDLAYAALEDVAAVPEVSADGLRRHDAVVRRLAAGAAAVAPVRFGVAVESLDALQDLVATRRSDLERLLALIRDREQMTLRLFIGSTIAERPSDPAPATNRDATGAAMDTESGTAYLRARAARLRPIGQAIDELRSVLAGVVAAERVEHHHASPAMASVYHLVARGGGPGYVERTARFAQAGSIRMIVSGPAPCYAFAEGLHL